MRITRKFRGLPLILVGSEEHGVYLCQLLPATEEWRNETDKVIFIHESTGKLFLFCSDHTTEDNFICCFSSFAELEKYCKSELERGI